MSSVLARRHNHGRNRHTIDQSRAQSTSKWYSIGPGMVERKVYMSGGVVHTHRLELMPGGKWRSMRNWGSQEPTPEATLTPQEVVS